MATKSKKPASVKGAGKTVALSAAEKKKKRAEIEKQLKEKRAEKARKEAELKKQLALLEVEKAKEAELRRQELEYERDNKLLFFNKKGYEHLGPVKTGKWELNPLQKKLVAALRKTEPEYKDGKKTGNAIATYKTFGLIGGNRISKTFSSTGIIALLAMRGHFPWEDPDEVGRWFWEIHDWEPPIKIRIMGDFWQKNIRTVIVPAIEELWPKSWGIVSRNNSEGIKAFFTDPLTRSTVELACNQSEVSASEGWKGHVVIYDEPPRREHFVALTRGLVDFVGIDVFAMSLVLGAGWVETDVIDRMVDEVVDGKKTGRQVRDPSVFSIEGTMYGNAGYGITEEGIDRAAKTWTEEEKQMRIYGKSALSMGTILQMKRDVHIIKSHNVPSSWLVTIAIDIGPGKGHDVMFMGLNPNGERFVIHTLDKINPNGAYVAEKILDVIHRTKWRVHPEVIIDPLAKTGKGYGNSIWDQIDSVFYAHDMYLVDGVKDPNAGTDAINALLNPPYSPKPLLYFFDRCTYAIKQCMYWRREINPRTGLPSIVKKEDDHPENLYRLIVAGHEWYPVETERYDEFAASQNTHWMDKY